MQKEASTNHHSLSNSPTKKSASINESASVKIRIETRGRKKKLSPDGGSLHASLANPSIKKPVLHLDAAGRPREEPRRGRPPLNKFQHQQLASLKHKKLKMSMSTALAASPRQANNNEKINQQKYLTSESLNSRLARTKTTKATTTGGGGGGTTLSARLELMRRKKREREAKNDKEQLREREDNGEVDEYEDEEEEKEEEDVEDAEHLSIANNNGAGEIEEEEEEEDEETQEDEDNKEEEEELEENDLDELVVSDYEMDEAKSNSGESNGEIFLKIKYLMSWSSGDFF